VSRRGARARGAVISQSVAEAAYEVLIHIERSIAKAATERARLEESRAEREGETLTIRARGRELAIELEQLTNSVHRDEIARAEQRMRIEALELKAVEELGVDTNTLVNEYGPHNDVPTFLENEAGEIITSVSFPIPTKAAYAKFNQPASRFALVGVFVAHTASGARVAITGAGNGVFRHAGMEAALTKSFTPEAVAGVAVDSTDLNADLHASKAYRAHLITVQTQRAVKQANG
jgi:hypothetical protein